MAIIIELKGYMRMLRCPGLHLSTLCVLLLFSSSVATQNQEHKSLLRFRVTLSKDLAPKAASGRLFVLMTGAPREMQTISINFPPGSTWVGATEVEYFAPSVTIVFDHDLNAYPKPMSQPA